MDGVIVSGTTHGVIFNLNDYAPFVGFNYVFRRKEHFTRVVQEDDHIIYTTIENITYKLDHLGISDHTKVHSINGVTPTSLMHLWELIIAILA